MIVHVSLEAPLSLMTRQPQRDIQVAPGTTAAALEAIIAQAEPAVRKLAPGCGSGSALVLTVNGKRLQPNYRLLEGDRVQVMAPVAGG